MHEKIEFYTAIVILNKYLEMLINKIKKDAKKIIKETSSVETETLVYNNYNAHITDLCNPESINFTDVSRTKIEAFAEIMFLVHGEEYVAAKKRTELLIN